MTDNEIKNSTGEQTQQNEATNKKFFQEIVEAHLPGEKIQQKLGDIDQEWKDDRVEDILVDSDKQKLIAYEKLAVQDLPSDWKNQLARLKQLEINQVDYNQIKEKLTDWTNAFSEKKPLQVQEEISDLEKKHEELKTWQNTFKNKKPQEIAEDKGDLLNKYDLVNKELKEWQETFSSQNPLQIKQKITSLENELGEWKKTWNNQELSLVKEKWVALQKRPEISITEEEFFADYARRKSQAQSQLVSEELAQEKEKNKDYQEKNKKLWSVINNFLKAERVRRYTLVKPVLTISQAREAITELLEETEREWENYLGETTENIIGKNSPLDLSLWQKDKEIQAREILVWIKEARVTLDYEKLLINWCHGQEYNSDYDFDGSLYLLKKYLEVKDIEVPSIL